MRRLLERWRARRYRHRFGLGSRNSALDAALAARRADPEAWNTPGGEAYLDALRRLNPGWDVDPLEAAPRRE